MCVCVYVYVRACTCMGTERVSAWASLITCVCVCVCVCDCCDESNKPDPQTLNFIDAESKMPLVSTFFKLTAPV